MREGYTSSLIGGKVVEVPIDPENVKNLYDDFYIEQVLSTNTPSWNVVEPFVYCGACGKELIDFGRVNSYDRHTGYRKIQRYLGCPIQNDDGPDGWFHSEHDLWTLIPKEDIPF